MQSRLFCASLLLAGIALSARGQTLPTPPPIFLHSGAGAVSFTLQNESAASMTLNLQAGPVLDCATNSVIAGASVTLKPQVGSDTLPTSIAPGKTLSLVAEAKGVSGASSARVAIFNAGVLLGKVDAFTGDAPLAISIDGDGTGDKSLAYTFGRPVVIAIKNGDAQSYHLHWEFLIDNRPESSGDLDMPANGSSRVTIAPTWAPFSFLDVIRPSNEKGVLLLSFIGPSSIPSGLLPKKSLPVALVMQPVPAFWGTLLAYGYVVFLLLLGGFFSFLASSMLPTLQKKGDLRAQLQDLADRTSTVSMRIDSYLRVLLRLERSRIQRLIDQANPWVPASADPLMLAAASIGTLGKRLAAAERLDEMRRKYDQESATAPPSVIDSIDANLQAAADQLHSTALSDSDLAAANSFFSKAQATLDMLNDSAALAKQVANNVAVVMARLKNFPADYSDMKAMLPGIFMVADSAAFSDPTNIVGPMLFALDHGAAAIQLVLDYVMVRASIPELPSAQAQPVAKPSEPAAAVAGEAAQDAQGKVGDAASMVAANAQQAAPVAAALPWDHLGEMTRQRLLKRECLFIELLGTLSWRALRDASLLIQEMREDTYEEDVLNEISKPGQAAITIDTQRTRPYLPVFFSITFKDSRFNDAAALRRLICHWVFPDDLNEYTWKVCHYFSGSEKGTVAPSGISQSPQQHVSADTDTNAQTKPSVAWRLPRFSDPTVDRELDIYATLRGQQVYEAQDVPIPPLKMTVRVKSVSSTDRSRLWAEVLQFAIAFGVALAGLLSGALEQLGKLEILPASIAIIGLGFSASAIKNLLTQSASSQTPAPARTR